MSIINLILIAFAMSTDAFAAAIGKGSRLRAPRLLNALKLGLLFGVIEGITPVIGWAIGSAGASYIEQIDHWVAFGLLLALGVHMIYASLNGDDDDDEAEAEPQVKTSVVATALTAVGTSIDAMAVGVSFAFLDVNIALAAVLIGLATFAMVTIGALLGERLGHLVGERAEAIGGVVLIAVGSFILYSHLSAA